VWLDRALFVGLRGYRRKTAPVNQNVKEFAGICCSRKIFSASCERYHIDCLQSYFRECPAAARGVAGDPAKAVEYDANPRDWRDLVNRRSAGSH